MTMKKIVTLLLAATLAVGTTAAASAAHWADPYYAELLADGTLNVSDFRNANENLDQLITREEFFALMISAGMGTQSTVASMSEFEDFNEVDTALSGYLAVAYEYGIMQGTADGEDLYIAPKSNITRQEAITVIGRTLGIAINYTPEFTDADSIASWATDYVTASEKTGLIGGYPDGTFMPQNNLTWGEALKILSDAKSMGFMEAPNAEIFAGDKEKAYKDGELLKSSFNEPSGIYISGSHMYIADSANNLIRRINGGDVDTYAGRIIGTDMYLQAVDGYRDDRSSQALFANPSDMIVSEGKVIVVDTNNNVIRQIEASIVNTFSGSGDVGHNDSANPANAEYNKPEGITQDSQGNIYIADTHNHVIRMISENGAVTTYAGVAETSGYRDGSTSTALFNFPTKITFHDGALYVSDSGNNRIRKIEDGAVTTYAGSGADMFDGDDIYVGDYRDGAATEAYFDNPRGLVFGEDDTLYVADTGNGMIRGIKDGEVFTVAGFGDVVYDDEASVSFVSPEGIEYDDGVLYVTDSFNNVVYAIEVE